MALQVNRKENKILYIIGNGFDIAHHLPTTYECFHKWLKANHDKHFVRAFEILYPHVKKNGEWRDIESALSELSLGDAISFDLNYQGCPDEVRKEKSFCDEYECGKEIQQVILNLHSCLFDWAHGIDNSKCLKVFCLNNDADYFTFNYTRTLEILYNILPEKVHHVHGAVGTGEELVIGYGDDSFEKDDYYIDDMRVNKDIIISQLRKNKKAVNAILVEPKFKQFVGALSEISVVVVFGHSCSGVDKSYYEEISKNIKAKAHWIFYVHDKERNKLFEDYANSIRQDKQTVEITNVSPIQCLK